MAFKDMTHDLLVVLNRSGNDLNLAQWFRLLQYVVIIKFTLPQTNPSFSILGQIDNTSNCPDLFYIAQHKLLCNKQHGTTVTPTTSNQRQPQSNNNNNNNSSALHYKQDKQTYILHLHVSFPYKKNQTTLNNLQRLHFLQQALLLCHISCNFCNSNSKPRTKSYHHDGAT
jgi:hypothetical protein